MKLKEVKFLTDENLGTRVPKFLLGQGFDVSSILENLGIPDTEVLSISNKEDRVLITSDQDFEIFFKENLIPAGVILLKLKDESVENKKRVLLRKLKSNKNLYGKFTIVEDALLK